MRFNDADLRAIYDRTTGKCHLCGKQLSLTNYGCFGEKGAWEVEHSHCRARGGSDRFNNLYAACISCNRSKGICTTRSARAREGFTRAPLSKDKRKVARRENAFVGGALTLFAAAALGGTGIGLLVLSGMGALGAYNLNPDKPWS